MHPALGPAGAQTDGHLTRLATESGEKCGLDVVSCKPDRNGAVRRESAALSPCAYAEDLNGSLKEIRGSLSDLEHDWGKKSERDAVAIRQDLSKVRSEIDSLQAE
jgi:hypothetical protein